MFKRRIHQLIHRYEWLGEDESLFRIDAQYMP